MFFLVGRVCPQASQTCCDKNCEKKIEKVGSKKRNAGLLASDFLPKHHKMQSKEFQTSLVIFKFFMQKSEQNSEMAPNLNLELFKCRVHV